MDLHGKVALLTGVRRVGAVVAETLARGGADVALVYNRSAREAEATAQGITALGRRAIAIQANLAVADDCRRAVETTIGDLGRIDILVAMASLYQSRPLDAVTVEAWDAQMNVELRSAFLCAQAAVPSMRANGGGRVGWGCVGAVRSPGVSEVGTGRSSMGHTGRPVSRSKTNANPCLVSCTTDLTARPSMVRSARIGAEGMS